MAKAAKATTKKAAGKTANKPAAKSAQATVTQVKGPTDADLKKHDPSELLDLLRRMRIIRAFEEGLQQRKDKGEFEGKFYSSAGREAVAVGADAGKEADDAMALWYGLSHRAFGHTIASWIRSVEDPEHWTAAVTRHVAEILGKSDGHCEGKGGAVHLFDINTRNLGATGIVGGNLPNVAGAALSLQLRQENVAALCILGDGAVTTGYWHETLNLAALWTLPLVIVIERNNSVMSQAYDEVSAVNSAAEFATAYGIAGITVDGLDVLAVQEAVHEATVRAARGEGPTVIEASVSNPEDVSDAKKCPVALFEKRLTCLGVADKKKLETIRKDAEKNVTECLAKAAAMKAPDATNVGTGVTIPVSISASERNREFDLRAKVRSGKADGNNITFAEAIRDALAEEMERDAAVFCLGEEIDKAGGVFGATAGLQEKFGAERVRDTPVSLPSLAGVATGAAMAHIGDVEARPVLEIMYDDFTPQALDQIANQAAKNRYFSGGRRSVPLVVRTQGGAGMRLGGHHSQSLEALWNHFPGLLIVAPSTPYDAKGLLKSAIRNDNPVIFVEHKMLYQTKGLVPKEDYTIPLGVAAVRRKGTDVTVLAYSRQVANALKAAWELEREGVDVEVIDLRTIKPLDMETITNSVKRTGRVVCVTEACRTGSVAESIAAQITESAFDYLDAAPVIVAGLDVPIPAAGVLEDAAVPGAAEIVAGVKKTLGRR